MVTWDGVDIDIKEGLVKKYSQLHNVSKTSHLHCLKCVVYEWAFNPRLIFHSNIEKTFRYINYFCIAVMVRG